MNHCISPVGIGTLAGFPMPPPLCSFQGRAWAKENTHHLLHTTISVLAQDPTCFHLFPSSDLLTGKLGHTFSREGISRDQLWKSHTGQLHLGLGGKLRTTGPDGALQRGSPRPALCSCAPCHILSSQSLPSGDTESQSLKVSKSLLH